MVALGEVLLAAADLHWTQAASASDAQYALSYEQTCHSSRSLIMPCACQGGPAMQNLQLLAFTNTQRSCEPLRLDSWY